MSFISFAYIIEELHLNTEAAAAVGFGLELFRVSRQLDTAAGLFIQGRHLLTLVQPIDERIHAEISHFGAQHVMSHGRLIVVPIDDDIDIALGLVFIDAQLHIVADQA